MVDLVAQLVEHLTFNQRVPGSSPGQVTKKKLSANWASFIFDSMLNALKSSFPDSILYRK